MSKDDFQSKFSLFKHDQALDLQSVFETLRNVSNDESKSNKNRK